MATPGPTWGKNVSNATSTSTHTNRYGNLQYNIHFLTICSDAFKEKTFLRVPSPVAVRMATYCLEDIPDGLIKMK